MATKKKIMPGRDALQRYLDEIGDTPLLSDVEEQELARRIQKGERSAIEQLTTANLRYVVTIARQYLPQLANLNTQSSNLSIDDLISEGNIGLMKAAAKFDASRGKRFVTFAAPYIRQCIEQALTKAEPSLAGHVLSTDESLPIGSNNNFTLLNVIEDKDAPHADAHIEQLSLSEDMRRAIHLLNDREQAVIKRYFGIDTDHQTMAEIGEELGLKRERIRQIRDKALRKLRKASSDPTD